METMIQMSAVGIIFGIIGLVGMFFGLILRSDRLLELSALLGIPMVVLSAPFLMTMAFSAVFSLFFSYV